MRYSFRTVVNINATFKSGTLEIRGYTRWKLVCFHSLIDNSAGLVACGLQIEYRNLPTGNDQLAAALSVGGTIALGVEANIDGAVNYLNHATANVTGGYIMALPDVPFEEDMDIVWSITTGDANSNLTQLNAYLIGERRH